MIELVDNPRTSAGSLARLISSDQSLTAKILKLANSAYYGFSREIATVNMAIVVLGFNAVREMGLSLSVFQLFKDDENSGLIWDMPKFWEHCIACGVAARLIGTELNSQDAGELFVAGLLHDVGKVVLNQYAHEDFKKIMEIVGSEHISLEDAEDRVIRIRHAAVGSRLAERWNLPESIVKAIGFHHTPWEAASHDCTSAIICCADFLVHTLGVGQSGRINAPPCDERVWTLFENHNHCVSEDWLTALTPDFFAAFDQAETFMNVVNE